jgi:hypothetical protein
VLVVSAQNSDETAAVVGRPFPKGICLAEFAPVDVLNAALDDADASL